MRVVFETDKLSNKENIFLITDTRISRDSKSGHYTAVKMNEEEIKDLNKNEIPQFIHTLGISMSSGVSG